MSNNESSNKTEENSVIEGVIVKNKPYSLKKKELTYKERRLVQEKIQNPAISNAQAVINAGYNCKNRNIASRVANVILNKPHIQSELKRYIIENNLDDKAISALNDILNEDTSTMEKASERVAARKLKLEVIQEISKIQGNYAPKTSISKSAKVIIQSPFKRK